MKSDMTNTYLTLYRGLALREDEHDSISTRISERGLDANDSKNWQPFECIDFRSRLKELLEKPDLSTEDTRPSEWIAEGRGGHSRIIGGYPCFCACGDDLGASYYALRHNRNERTGFIQPLVVKFKAPVDDVQVDGRDLLYQAFQFGETRTVADCFVAIFGEAILPYLDKALMAPRESANYRIALCDLAVQDPAVVITHSRNQVVLGGRHGTVFRSAFMVRSPISADRIVTITTPVGTDFIPEIKHEDFLALYWQPDQENGAVAKIKEAAGA